MSNDVFQNLQQDRKILKNPDEVALLHCVDDLSQSLHTTLLTGDGAPGPHKAFAPSCVPMTEAPRFGRLCSAGAEGEAGSRGYRGENLLGWMLDLIRNHSIFHFKYLTFYFQKCHNY